MHPEAGEEAAEASFFFAERNPDAADSFVRELEHSIRLIIESPLTWPRLSSSIHRRKIEGFPHWIIYPVTETSIRILAVAHPSRRQDYWRGRLEQ